MARHTIAKSRPTNLCFWILLTKHLKSFAQSRHHVVPFQFHCISIFISNLGATFVLYNVFVLHIWTYDWNNTRAVEVHYLCFRSICQHWRIFAHLLLKYGSTWKQLYSKIFKHRSLFSGAVWKVALNFLGWFYFYASGFICRTSCGLGRWN